MPSMLPLRCRTRTTVLIAVINARATTVIRMIRTRACLRGDLARGAGALSGDSGRDSSDTSPEPTSPWRQIRSSRPRYDVVARRHRTSEDESAEEVEPRAEAEHETNDVGRDVVRQRVVETQHVAADDEARDGERHRDQVDQHVRRPAAVRLVRRAVPEC